MALYMKKTTTKQQKCKYYITLRYLPTDSFTSASNGQLN